MHLNIILLEPYSHKELGFKLEMCFRENKVSPPALA